MAYSDVNPLSKQITILTGLFVVGMMAFGLALSYYKNILFDRRLDVMKEQNEKLRQENVDKHAQLEYVRSTQYKDKYAKQNLNRVNEGEKVLILLANNDQIALTAEPEDVEAEQEYKLEQMLKDLPVIEHWKLYLFAKDELKTMKESL